MAISLQEVSRPPEHSGIALLLLSIKLTCEILFLEFLEPMGVSQSKFARHLGVPIQRVNELVKGKRGITPETAWLLSASLGTTPEFWMNLQVNYELTSHGPPKGIKRLVA